MKKIGVVILNYNSYSDTIRLVQDLQAQTLASDLWIVVVDNASPNDSPFHLKSLENQYPNVSVLLNETNLGYAKGNNCGLKYLDVNIHPQYVAIMNNDIHFPNYILDQLAKRYHELNNPAIIAPKQLNTDNQELCPYQMNSFLDDCLNLFYIFKVFHKRNMLKYRDNTGQNAMRVEMIPGSFMFSSFPRFKEMGFFYPNTFLFVEERFVAVKAKQLGYYNYILLETNYIHDHSKTINKSFTNIKKYKILYDGWLEFTRVHRSNGELKAKFLKFLMKFSLLEIRIISFLKSICI